MNKLVLLIISTLVLKSYCNEYKYVLAQEWPGSICKTNHCQAQYTKNYDGSKFSLHGLWPDKQSGTICQNVQSCTHESYDSSKLASSTLQEMDRAWVGHFSDTNGFRDHEWSKHGTCFRGEVINSNGDQDNYFKTVLNLWEMYDLYKGLAMVNVRPSNTQVYTYNQVTSGIKTVIASYNDGFASDSMYQIQCASDSQGHSMITQVYICLDDSYRPMNCDCAQSLSASTSCGSQITFPVYQKP